MTLAARADGLVRRLIMPPIPYAPLHLGEMSYNDVDARLKSYIRAGLRPDLPA